MLVITLMFEQLTKTLIVSIPNTIQVLNTRKIEPTAKQKFNVAR